MIAIQCVPCGFQALAHIARLMGGDGSEKAIGSLARGIDSNEVLYGTRNGTGKTLQKGNGSNGKRFAITLAGGSNLSLDGRQLFVLKRHDVDKPRGAILMIES
jgi:hypothetical protein